MVAGASTPATEIVFDMPAVTQKTCQIITNIHDHDYPWVAPAEKWSNTTPGDRLRLE